jgi:hypothetical protein
MEAEGLVEAAGGVAARHALAPGDDADVGGPRDEAEGVSRQQAADALAARPRRDGEPAELVPGRVGREEDAALERRARRAVGFVDAEGASPGDVRFSAPEAGVLGERAEQRLDLGGEA